MRENRRAAPDFSALQGRHVLIALSGGPDSVALAVMLADVQEAMHLRLSAAHLDHGIRPESADDAEWCAVLCSELHIPFFTARVDVPAEAARTGEGLETVARRLRRRWLEDLRKRLGADCIALAHHMDDQAETVLMHLARGTGPEGIGGMSAISGTLVRPLLGMRKRDLVQFLTDRGFTWREDATNALADTPRNALRLYGIPELEKSYPGFVPAAARYALSAGIESDYVAAQTSQWLKDNLFTGPYGRYLSLEQRPHPAILRRSIRAICGSDLSWAKLNAVAALADAARGSTEVSGGLIAEKGRRGLYFLRGNPPVESESPLLTDGITRLSDICEITARPIGAVPIRDEPMRQALDFDALQGAVLRTRRPGDRIRPLGCGDKLLSDFYTDRKLDRPLRDFTALIARGRRVLWVCGLGISEEAAISAGTQRAVELTCRYHFARWI